MELFYCVGFDRRVLGFIEGREFDVLVFFLNFDGNSTLFIGVVPGDLLQLFELSHLEQQAAPSPCHHEVDEDILSPVLAALDVFSQQSRWRTWPLVPQREEYFKEGKITDNATVTFMPAQLDHQYILL